MTSPTRDSYNQECLIDVHPSLSGGGKELDAYLLKSTQELETITELAERGETVGLDSREWMLAQVDIIVETIGNESIELDDVRRSNLLQLLLAIANLNEQLRHQSSLGF